MSSKTGGNVDRLQSLGINLSFTAEKKFAWFPIRLRAPFADFVFPNQFTPHTTGRGQNPKTSTTIS